MDQSSIILTFSTTTGRGLVHHEVASQRLSGCELIAQALELMVKRMYKVGSAAFTRDCLFLNSRDKHTTLS
jgi:hypothetical protein